METIEHNAIPKGWDFFKRCHISLNIDWIVLKFGTFVEYGHKTMCNKNKNFFKNSFSLVSPQLHIYITSFFL